MRERLDRVDPQSFRPAFNALFARFQRGGGLKKLRWGLGGYLSAIDGAGFFNAGSISCKSCCVRKRRSGAVEYFHHTAATGLVSPDTKAVFPLMPEMAARGDGSPKNGCETSAVKRLLRNIRREHPHLEAAVLTAGLHSKAPQVRLLREPVMSRIIGAKPGGCEVLCGQFPNGHARVIKKDDDKTLTFRQATGPG